MHTRHLSTPTQALYRVFVLPALSQKPLSLSLGSLSSSSATTRTKRRTESDSPTSSRTFTSSAWREIKTRAPETRKELWNEEIRSRQIYLINPTTNTIMDPDTNAVPAPSFRDDILNKMDHKTHRLVQVAPGVNIARQRDALDGLDANGRLEEQQTDWVPIPVCKVVDKKEAYASVAKRKEQAKEKKKSSAIASSVKTLEMNWAIDMNDLGHRLDKVQEFLGEGRKVEIVLAAKKRGRKASMEECELVLRRIRGVAEDIDGAKEVGKMDGKVGGFAVLRFAGTVPEAKEG